MFEALIKADFFLFERVVGAGLGFRIAAPLRRAFEGWSTSVELGGRCWRGPRLGTPQGGRRLKRGSKGRGEGFFGSNVPSCRNTYCMVRAGALLCSIDRRTFPATCAARRSWFSPFFFLRAAACRRYDRRRARVRGALSAQEGLRSAGCTRWLRLAAGLGLTLGSVTSRGRPDRGRRRGNRLGGRYWKTLRRLCGLRISDRKSTTSGAARTRLQQYR